MPANRLEHLRIMSYLNWCGRGRPARDDWADWFHSEGLRQQGIREAAYFHWLDRGRPSGDDWADWFWAEESEDTFLNQISLTMQRQVQTNWCWAAVAVSVSLYFSSSSTWTQCTVVNAELNRTDCCTQGNSANCNRAWFLGRALTRTGNLAGMVSRSATLSEIKTEIDASRPVCLRVGWNGGGGHSLAIDGYNRDLGMIDVDDPWFGASDVTELALRSAYQGTGTWTHTYWVQP